MTLKDEIIRKQYRDSRGRFIRLEAGQKIYCNKRKKFGVLTKLFKGGWEAKFDGYKTDSFIGKGTPNSLIDSIELITE